MRKLLLAPLLAAASCSSGPDDDERSEELYDRIAYLRAAFDTAYADYNTVALEAVGQELRRHAARDLELFGQDLKGSHPQRRQLAAFALAFSVDPKAQEHLIRATKDTDPSVVEVALVALGMCAFENTPLEIFRSNFSSPSWRIRQAALYGLRFQLKEGKTGALLTDVVKLLEDKQMDVRNEALIVLRRMATGEAVEPIVRLCLKDPHPLIRQNAAITLSALGVKAREATPQLIEMLKDDDTKVVEAAWTALNRIHGKDLDRTYATWRDWYEDEEKKVEYVCEVHPEVVQSSPGQCPQSGCLRRLVRQAKPEDYICPVHSDIRLKKEGRCSTCRRALIPLRPDFVCPDHPASRAHRPGPCSTCSKERLLVVTTYECPEHVDVGAPKAGRCSRCERLLVPSQYVCPDHPESRGEVPGTCSKCGKDRILWRPTFYCTDHPDVEVSVSGKCSRCEKELVPPYFVCPDHADSWGSRPGPCGQCTKERVPVRPAFVCPDHTDVTSPRPGKCSRCGKELTPKKE